MTVHACNDMTAALDRVEAVRNRLNDVLKGKRDVVQHVLVCLLARGHLLLEDRPGLGKTTLAKALADAVGGRFARIQCTPDLQHLQPEGSGVRIPPWARFFRHPPR